MRVPLYPSQTRTYTNNHPLVSVNSILSDSDAVELETFRNHAFVPEKPIILQARPDFISSGAGPRALPALKEWFKPLCNVTSQKKNLTETMVSQSCIENFYPFELRYPQYPTGHAGGEVVENFLNWLEPRSNNAIPPIRSDEHGLVRAIAGIETPPKGKSRLLRFNAPISLLNNAIKFNQERREGDQGHLKTLYLAQAPLNDLSPALQLDVPTPRLVKEAGKGDIYDSSLWLGLEPTYTPLHRDPNPNLFIQLCSSKVVRLLPPGPGLAIYQIVQEHLGIRSGNSRMRGVEMMEEPAKSAFLNAVWWDQTMADQEAMDDFEKRLAAPRAAIQEAVLGPGDALFIPKGWWHSVRSKLADGRLNGSLNWWFR